MRVRQFILSCGVWAICANVAIGSAPPVPSPDEQTAAIDAARTSALTFTDRLPDFICTQVTRRWVRQSHPPASMVVAGPRGRMGDKTIRLNEEESWKLRDTLTIQLTYFGQKEQYKLLLVNGSQTKESYESLGGSTSYGDFGSILGILFQASSEAKFIWDHWAVLNGQPVMVFAFNVDRAHSQWHIGYETQEVITAFKGFVFIDPSEHRVLKLKANADEIPSKFPIQRSGIELDYQLQKVGDTSYLLPLKATNWSDTKNLMTKNEAEFRLYRKFSADSKIDFDTPAPLPETQTKEIIPNN